MTQRLSLNFLGSSFDSITSFIRTSVSDYFSRRIVFMNLIQKTLQSLIVSVYTKICTKF